MQITIYHNPKCSKSRQGLDFLLAHDVQPLVIDYIKAPLTADEITHLLEKLGMKARELMRTKEALYKELKLDNPKLSEEKLIAAMATHPKLIERPIVVKGKKAVIARPTEKILELL